MSKTKKKLFYSTIVAAVVLLAFFAAGFMSAYDGTPVVAGTGEGHSGVLTKEVTTSDTDYSALNVLSDIKAPGSINSGDIITNNVVPGATPITDASGLDSALKTNGNYYLVQDISFSAFTGNTSAATNGTFGGVLYGNGHTITINVPASAKYSFQNGDGTYGFLVKYLTGTIRDVNVVINAASGGSLFGFNTGNAGRSTQPDGESAYMARIGGIAGGMSTGLIHNCTVTYTGTLRLQNNAVAVGDEKNAWGGDNMANIFGGVTAFATGGVISYTNVTYNGSLINVGQQNSSGSNRLMINTGGFVGQIGNGTVYLRKVSLLGSGTLESEAHTYGSKNWAGVVQKNGYATVLTGGLVGWVSSAQNAGFEANGVFINLTKSGGAVKSNYLSTGGVANWACSTATDSIDHDYGDKNTSSYTNASEMRDSYGIGAMYKGKTVVLNNVYMTSSMAQTIKNHHPFAIHEIAGINEAKNSWIRWNWTYTLVDASTLGNEFIFARNTAMDGAYSYSSSTANDANAVRGVYYRVSNQSASNFVYQIKQGSDSAYDLYSIYTKTYNNFGTNGTVYVPAMYTGYVSTNDPDIGKTTNKINTSTFTSSNPTGNDATTYNVSAIYGSYLYMDFDMSKGYDGTDRYADGYQGSGNNYTYTYNGNMLYVPAFAGYKTSYGTGEKVSFTEDELNSMELSSTHFSLSSSYTIENSGNTDYSLYNYLHWSGAGNVGTYTMTYNKDVSEAKFISKDGNNYYCAFMDSYPSKTVSVVPREVSLEWSAADFVYDGTGKDLTATFRGLPAGNELGNNDSSMLGVAVAYSASNENLLVQNKPYHAGEYTATATLTYNGTTENQLTGNFTLASSVYPFEVEKAQMSVQPENVVSLYGNDHAALLAGAKVTVSGNWIGDDQSSFVFTVKTVNDTINWATTKGEYDTTVGVALAEGAAEELLGDYEFKVTQGTLTINERPINGTLKINGGVYNGTNYNAVLTIDESVKVGTDSVYTLDYVLNGEATEEAVNAGEYVIRITPEADKYAIGTIVIEGKDELYVDGETKLVVDQRSVDVTLSFDNGYVYDGANKVTGYAVQEQDGDAGVMTGEDAGLVMSYNGETEAILPASYTATATFGNSNYKAGTINGGSFTVEKADLSEIDIVSDSAVYDGGEKSIGYDIVGVAGEENILSLVGQVTVTYNSSTALPVNAGKYEVEIVVAEGAAYNAKSVSATFTVNKADITFVPVTETTYTGKTIEPKYSISAPGMEDASSLKNYVTASHTEIKTATNYEITLSFAGTNNYNEKTQTYYLNVGRADLSIDLDDGQTAVYNGLEQQPVYGINALVEGDSYGEVTLTVSGDNTTDGKAINAGTYTFTVSVAESTNYNAVEKSVTFTIDRYKLDLIGATEQFVTVINENDAPVTEIARYLGFVDIALIDDTGVYDNGSLSYVTKVNGSEATDIVFESGKGVFTMEVSVKDLDTVNYAFDTVTITVNVLDAGITVTVNGAETTLTSVTFGETLTVEAKGSYGGGEQENVQETTWYAKGEGGNYDVALDAQPTDAGEYMAMFRYTFGADSNYVTRALYLTISPKAVTVTLDGSGVNITYGDEITEASFAGAKYTTDAGEMSLTLEYTTNAAQYSPIGSYTLGGTVVAVADGNVGNYTFTVVPSSVTVVRRTVYVKADDVSAVYGDEVILSGFRVYTDEGGATEWSGYAGADQLKVNLSVQSGILVVGNYEISVAPISGGNPNYIVNATVDKGVLTVEKRAISITVSDVNVTYGTAELPAVTGSITGGSLVNGDTLGTITAVWNGEAALGTLDASEYVLTDYATLSAKLNSAQEGTNYKITFETSTKLTVSPKNVTITFVGWQSADGMLGAENTVVYNAGVWTPSATIDGLLNGDVVEIAIDDETEIKNAGTYSRKLSLSGTDAGNYVAEDCVAKLEVLPYKTEITVDQTVYEYTYGDAKTAISPSITVLDGDVDDGSFVQKNYVGDNTGVTGTQVGWDDVWNAGSYTVAISYAGGNYTADTVYITVTVDKKMLNKVDAINGGDLGSSVYNASNVNITADMVADLTSFAGLDDYIAVVYKSGDSIVNVVRNAGAYTVDLVLKQNDNYAINGDGDSLLNAPATYTVKKAQAEELNFSLTYANKVYNGEDMSDYIRSVIAVSGINGEPVTGASLELSGSDGTILVPVNSDVYAVYVKASEMTNYENMDAPVYVGEFTIDKVYVAIDAIELPDATYTYDSLEKALAGIGIQQSAVLKKVIYEYSGSDGYLSATGAVGAGKYNVKMTVLFDKLNSRFGSDVSLETVVDEEAGECCKLELNATLTIDKAVPTVTVDKNTLATYFDGYDHAIEFGIAGVGNDSAMSASYDASAGAGQEIVIDGLGTFTVRYYTDAGYSNLLTGEDGSAALPITVLLSDGKTVPYYMQISFTSANSNYGDAEYKNSGYDMALYIMQSVVTLSFDSLSAPYGMLKNRSAANDYVNANMKYSYTVNDEGSASVNYDPEAMLVITYNLNSFDVNTGTYDISVEARAAKTEYADSVTAVVRNAGSIKLNITAADVSDEMKAAFTDVSDFYGNKTYTASDFGWQVKGIMDEDVAYTVSYNGATDFSIANAGEYDLTVSVPEGNYKAWSGTVRLSIAKVGLDVVWTMNGQAPVEGAFTKTYDGAPADISIEVLGADGVTARAVYVNSEGAEIDDQYVVGTHTAKAVLSDDNYFVNEDCLTVTVVIEAIVLDEDTIRGWISDDSDVYGSVQGIDLTGLPEGFGATDVVYEKDGATYDPVTIKSATVGEYKATVTVSNGSSSGSASFVYTIDKREVTFTVNVSVTAGKRPSASNATLVADKSLASGDTAVVDSLTLSSDYKDDLALGVYDLKDYVSGVTVRFNKNADCYSYKVVLGDLTVSPDKAPVITEMTANYNTITVRFEKAGLYAYKVGSRGTWVSMSSESDTLIVVGLDSEKAYTIYVAYAGFTDVNTSSGVKTTADPGALSQMITDILEDGLTLEEKEAYENILAYYEKIAEEDRPEIQSQYDALVAQFNALGDTTDGGGNGVDALVIAVCAVCLVLIVASISGVIVAAVLRKRRDRQALEGDDFI